eukprot:GEMP01038666.1.p2 GENE.GEMP01038666.1~~GEMP01038666.1.p2  ORF type:complete len:105 (+),score=4.96 GEMP01038666.1:1195-1509(+)
MSKNPVTHFGDLFQQSNYLSPSKLKCSFFPCVCSLSYEEMDSRFFFVVPIFYTWASLILFVHFTKQKMGLARIFREFTIVFLYIADIYQMPSALGFAPFLPPFG